ncbi:MAG: class I SAM-dependent methyltransferase [Cytophagales bacterium]|nr:class I SAM-dependent methyltransferase [Cytophagales bacterium]
MAKAVGTRQGSVTMSGTRKEWFAEWFDSPYYHILYKNRDTTEASAFLSRLLEFLELPQEFKVLDLACGKGRHSLFLNQQGFDVVGYDLSSNSIQTASIHSNARLKFAVQDMRLPFPDQNFDFVFNLFTSFGYFSHREENIQVLKNIYNSSKPQAGLVIDYFNTHKVIVQMGASETKTLEGIEFSITREVIQGQIVKSIDFSVQGKAYSFKEKVSAFELSDFEEMLKQAGFKIKSTFGDYQLNLYQPSLSDRLIILAYKY